MSRTMVVDQLPRLPSTSCRAAYKLGAKGMIRFVSFGVIHVALPGYRSLGPADTGRGTIKALPLTASALAWRLATQRRGYSGSRVAHQVLDPSGRSH